MTSTADGFTRRGYGSCPSCGQFVWMETPTQPAAHEAWSGQTNGPVPCDAGRLMPDEWQVRTGIVVRSADGWHGGFNDVPWNARISRDEFIRRALVSQTDPWPSPLLDERPRPARRAAITGS